MSSIIIFVVVLVVFFLGYILISAQKQKNYDDLLNKTLDKHSIVPDQTFSYNECSLMVSEDAKKIYYAQKNNQNGILLKSYDFSEINDFEVKVDDHSVYKSSVTNTVAGAAIGGGIGALVGSQFGKKKKAKLNNVRIVLYLNSIKEPTLAFNIYDPMEPTNLDSFLSQQALDEAEKWKGIFTVVMANKEA